MSDKLAPADKHKYIHDGKTIYEWDQTLSEVNIYIEVPTGVKAKQLFVDISSSHISLGIHPNPPYLDVSLSLCLWVYDDVNVEKPLAKNHLTNEFKSLFVEPFHSNSTDRVTLQTVCLRTGRRTCKGLKSNWIPFRVLQRDLSERVKAGESYWTIGELCTAFFFGGWDCIGCT